MQSINRNHLNLISIFILMMGAGTLLATGVFTTSTYQFITRASRAEGKVIRLTPRDLEPVIRFVPAGSTTAVEFVGTTSVITDVINQYAVGDKVPVLYRSDAGYPSGFQTNIDTIDSLWGLQLFYAVLGSSMFFNALHVRRVWLRDNQ